MKNIKYIGILLFQLAILQFTFGQSAEDNGRPAGINPKTVSDTPTAPTSRDVPKQGSFTVDFDVAKDSEQEVPMESDTYYPVDMEIAREEIMASTHPAEIAQKINDLNDMVEDLLRITEELRLENNVIRESLNNCCSNASLGLSANDAYLLQNAPNPFNASSEIRYFVPNGLENVEIRISNIKGEVLSAIQIKEAGYGTIDVGSNIMANGTFVYTLSVKGEIIDSKVMIKTQ